MKKLLAYLLLILALTNTIGLGQGLIDSIELTEEFDLEELFNQLNNNLVSGESDIQLPENLQQQIDQSWTDSLENWSPDDINIDDIISGTRLDDTTDIMNQFQELAKAFEGVLPQGFELEDILNFSQIELNNFLSDYNIDMTSITDAIAGFLPDPSILGDVDTLLGTTHDLLATLGDTLSLSGINIEEFLGAIDLSIFDFNFEGLESFIDIDIDIPGLDIDALTGEFFNMDLSFLGDLEKWIPELRMPSNPRTSDSLNLDAIDYQSLVDAYENHPFFDGFDFPYTEAELEVPRLGLTNYVVIPSFEACKLVGDFINCDYTVTSVMMPIEYADQLQQEITAAFNVYVFAVAKEIHDELNQNPPCYTPIPVCLPIAQPVPIPNPICIVERIGRGLFKGITENLPPYYQTVNDLLLAYLPFGVMWGAPVPYGVFTAPMFSYSSVEPLKAFDGRDTRSELYLESGINYDISLEPNNNEIGYENPGLDELEPLKEGLGIATPYEYQQFGYQNFLNARGAIRPVFYMATEPGALIPIPYPQFVIKCQLGIIFDLIGVPMPLPPIPTPIIDFGSQSIAEGYPINGTLGFPVYSVPFTQ